MGPPEPPVLHLYPSSSGRPEIHEGLLYPLSEQVVRLMKDKQSYIIVTVKPEDPWVNNGRYSRL